MQMSPSKLRTRHAICSRGSSDGFGGFCTSGVHARPVVVLSLHVSYLC